jgi:hypothetical protein
MSEEAKKERVPINLELVEETLSKVLISALPGLRPEDHTAFAESAAKAIRSAYVNVLRGVRHIAEPVPSPDA